MRSKAEIFIEQVKAKQVQTLRLIARHIGMLPLTPDVAAASRSKITDDMLVWALWTLAGDVAPSKRAVGMLLLDLVSGDWREVAGPELMGNAIHRGSREVQQWRRAVIANDNGTCRHCGSTDSPNAHHIIRWAEDPSQRLNVDNGMVLCKPCHDEEHRVYG
jgi:hypothetical protein